MRQNIEEEIAKEQAGFCRRRGTRDQISNLRLLSEKFRERKKQLFLCFIDYRKAFDCVCHEELWEILTRLNFPKHLIGLVESLYKQQLSSVRTIHGKTDWFHNGRGVRQDCILSSYLFNLYTEWIMREALEENDGVSIGGTRVSNLRYADDTVLIAEDANKLQSMVKRVSSISKQMWIASQYKQNESACYRQNAFDDCDYSCRSSARISKTLHLSGIRNNRKL